LRTDLPWARLKIRHAAFYFLPQVESPIPEAQRLVPSENVEHKKPARQSVSPEQVPHSSVEAQEDKAPMIRAAMRANIRFEVMDE